MFGRKTALLSGFIFSIFATLPVCGNDLPKTATLPDGRVVNLPDLTDKVWEPFLLQETPKELVDEKHTTSEIHFFFGTVRSFTKQNKAGDIEVFLIVSYDPLGKPYSFAWKENRKNAELFEAIISEKGEVIVGDENWFEWKFKNGAIREVRARVNFRGKRVGKRIFKNLAIKGENPEK